MNKGKILSVIFGKYIIPISDFFYNKLHISFLFFFFILFSLVLIIYIWKKLLPGFKAKSKEEKIYFFWYFGLLVFAVILTLVSSIRDQQKMNNDPDYGINKIIKLKQDVIQNSEEKKNIVGAFILFILAVLASLKETFHKGERVVISFPPEFYLKLKRKKSLVKELLFDEEGIFTLILKTNNRAKPVSEIHSANLVFCKCDNCYDLYYYERNRDEVILKEKINKDNLKSGEKYQLKICWCGAQLKLTVKFTKDGFTLVKEKYEVLK